MRVLVFDTTHHALWAEELALAQGLAVDVVPAPAEAKARCDLALAFLDEDEADLLRVLAEAEVPYRVHGGS